MSAGRGFSLVEALVAVLVLGLIMPVALAGLSAGVRGGSDAARLEVAQRVAESRLARLLADGSWAGATGGGTCAPEEDGEDAEGLRWAVALAPWREPGLRQLTIATAWDGDPLDPEVPLRAVLTTLVAEPPP